VVFGRHADNREFFPVGEREPGGAAESHFRYARQALAGEENATKNKNLDFGNSLEMTHFGLVLDEKWPKKGNFCQIIH